METANGGVDPDAVSGPGTARITISSDELDAEARRIHADDRFLAKPRGRLG